MKDNNSHVPPVPLVKEEKKKHPVLTSQEIFQWLEKHQNSNIKRTCLYETKSPYQVIIVPEAYRELEGIVHLGKPHGNNVFEQQIRGCGHYFSDGNGGFSIIITHVQKVYAAMRNPVGSSVMGSEMSALTYDQLDEELKIINQCEKQLYRRSKTGRDIFFTPETPIIPVCWIHTHPNLHAWFSTTDLANVTCAAGDPWASLCIDPMRCEFKAICGQNNTPALVIIYYYCQNILEDNAVNQQKNIDEISENVDETIAEYMKQFRYYAGLLINSGYSLGGAYREKKGWRKVTKIKVNIKIKRKNVKCR